MSKNCLHLGALTESRHEEEHGSVSTQAEYVPLPYHSGCSLWLKFYGNQYVFYVV
jgi:hypothetical protein